VSVVLDASAALAVVAAALVDGLMVPIRWSDDVQNGPRDVAERLSISIFQAPLG
jgi:hypothetical protein